MLAVLLIAIVLLALLAIPLAVEMDLSSGPAGRRALSMTWAFGLVNVAVPLDQERQEAGQDKPEKRTPRKTGRDHWRALLDAAFRRRVLRYFRDLWRAVRKQDLFLRLRLGLGDPADTGQLWSVLGPLSGWLAGSRCATVILEPEFAETAFEWESRGRVAIVPLQLVGITFLLLLSPAFWQGLRRS